jgi:hypothetical protein
MAATRIIAIAVGICFWIAANLMLFRVLRQVKRKLAEPSFPNAASPRFCYNLWKKHKVLYPKSTLRFAWITSYAASFLGIVTAFTMLIVAKH